MAITRPPFMLTVIRGPTPPTLQTRSLSTPACFESWVKVGGPNNSTRAVSVMPLAILSKFSCDRSAASFPTGASEGLEEGGGF